MQIGIILNNFKFLENLTEFMAKDKIKRQRQTNQRQAILNFLQTAPYHPTAVQIFHGVRRLLPRISLGTVYRNLKILEYQKKVMPLYYQAEHVRYEIAKPVHYHFCCLQCDKVIDIVLEPMLELNSQIERRHQVVIKHHSLIFYGLCQECSQLLKKNR